MAVLARLDASDAAGQKRPHLLGATMPRRYAILDVFTDRPLAGNPLAVVLDGDGLSDDRMQAVAREFNHSETVFVRPPENAAHSARIRIFTPRRELPFAGHPTVGTAVLLALEGAAKNPARHEAMLVLEETVGPVRCGAFVKEGRGIREGHVIFDVPKIPEAVPATLDVQAIAAALGLLPTEIGFENHQPSAFSAGAPYVFVPIRDLAALARAVADPGAFRAALGGVSHAMYLYCRETVGTGRQFHARCFAPDAGITEDPATGGAAAAFPGAILRFDTLPSGSHHLVIEQGFEMGRPSLIGLEIDVGSGRIEAARIGGDAVVVAEGTLAIE
jgi:trans-2,3-dihydro-3-hydroxyanthranilate isomerase